MSESKYGISKESGFTLIEIIMALAIVSSSIVGINMIVERFANDTKVSLAAEHTRTFGEAAKAYIKDNYAAVQLAATPTFPVMIDVSTLISSGHLTSGFVAKNGFNQNVCVLVLEPAVNRMQALVVSEGGDEIDDLSLGSLAVTVGGSGGGIYSSNSAEILGSIGGWRIPTAIFDGLTNDTGRRCDGTPGAVSISAGHPVMALWFENGDTSSAFLARDAVPGRPELNHMNTPLVMNSVQAIDAACSVLGAVARDVSGLVLSCQGGRWKSQSTYWQDPVPNYAALPACNALSAGHSRVVSNPSVGSGPRAYTCTGASWAALSVDDQGNSYQAGIAANAGVNSSGRINVSTNDWSMFMLDGGGNANASAKTAPGSAYVNDLYVRSVGKWASEILTGNSGLRGMLSPFKGKQIYCAAGAGQAWAYVDALGDPYTRLYVSSHGYDSGWVPGHGATFSYFSSTGGMDSVTHTYTHNVGWSIFEMGYSFSTTDGQPGYACVTNWPAT